MGYLEFNSAVITMQAVVEVPALDNDPAPPWPVAQTGPWSWLPLNAVCTDEELGLFVAALAARIEVLPPRQCLQRILISDDVARGSSLRVV